MYIKTFENFNFFKNTSSYISNLKIHSICKKYGIKNYTINPDESIDVDGNVNLYKKGLTKIPIKFREVSGDFNCNFNNNLTSLEGCPERVGGGFSCSYNNLITLEFSPKRVEGDFYSSFNKLIYLKGCPERVGGHFYCDNNKLTTLEFAPKRVDGNFYCQNNDIWTFEWFETSIGSDFYCNVNPIYAIWRLFGNKHKFDLLNEIDAIRPGRIIILDRLNEFLIMIGKEPVEKINGYKCI